MTLFKYNINILVWLLKTGCMLSTYQKNIKRNKLNDDYLIYLKTHLNTIKILSKNEEIIDLLNNLIFSLNDHLTNLNKIK